MILRCTKKLRDELKLAAKDLLGSEPAPTRLDEWFCCCGLTNSRSVLGSMNDISYRYLGDIEMYGDAGRLRGLVGKRLNRNPLSAIGHRYAIDAMRGEVSQDRH